MGSFSKARGIFLFIPLLQKMNMNCLKYFHMAYSQRSTIFALSTAPGLSAVAIIRISGPNTSCIFNSMVKLKKDPEPRKAILCRIKNPQTNELLDKALMLWFPSPNSFTGEDLCELHVHGGTAVIKSILKALQQFPLFRAAEPGEFTKRAFLANKLDLTEIEGLADLLHAETEAQQQQALKQMDGALHKLYTDWSNRLKKCLANIEAYIDFSEDQHLDNAFLESVQQSLNELKVEIKCHLSDNRRGERLRKGVSTVLIGRPNVGKSSLLNNLCQRDIAIVSPIAGTTRDIIETCFNLGGYLVNISDTAGIRETGDCIEQEGVKRAKNRSSSADILIFILEAPRILQRLKSNDLLSDGFIDHLLLTELGKNFLDGVGHFTSKSSIILLFNKVDLLNETEKKKLIALESTYPQMCTISCTQGIGMNKFLDIFLKSVKDLCLSHAEEPSITQERHRIFVQCCLDNILQYEEFVEVDIALAAEKLRLAMNQLGKITGKVKVEDILDIVFKDFCIGK